MSLRLYTALVKKDSNNKIEDISLIKSGFSFGIFFFSVFWLLSHTMWRGAIIFLLFEMLVLKLFNSNILGFAEVFVVQIGLFIIAGLNAKNWLSRNLQKYKGYEKIGYVLAQNEEEARLKSMKSWHRNSPDLSFDEFSEEIIDPDFYLRSVRGGGSIFTLKSLSAFRNFSFKSVFKSFKRRSNLLREK